ncbi:Rpn family recombination-promoting nuclease/putative transposase [Bacillus thuringiensis]|uniref:Rpn family recombination-promoting nuclease/putative transposase n=1 Tax=Bacillus thuringiensis TaxID=1428 RepID=UPI000E54C0F2|nr:Rpn family recombination-promoting nuclease/putative transposase [Bacillus thuringiensis]MDZ3952308.1 Rpn family recombination-promoting nuclease/putative transposase [Bacillus thuringiensis]RGP42312.1 ATPase [Bacillus thuringiensis]
MNRVNLRIDFAFKHLFGSKGNEDILKGFLNAVLQKSLVAPITSVSLDDRHLQKEYKEDKLSIMDVKAVLDTGEHVNIEIQLANKHDMQKRSLYYWSKLYASQMQEGMAYSALKKAITINVLDFVLYPNYEQFQTTGVLWDVGQNFCIHEDIEIHYIELPKLFAKWKDAQINPWHDSLVRWLLLLTAHEDLNLSKTLEEIAVDQDETLHKAIYKWDAMSHNIDFRREYEAREKLLLDEKAAMVHAKQKGMEEGLKQGLQQGLEQGRIQIIQQMYSNGFELQEIAKIVNETVEEIQRILDVSQEG